MSQIQKLKELDGKQIGRLDELFAYLGKAKSKDSKEWDWNGWQDRVKAIENEMIELVDGKSLKDVYKAYAKFYNGRVMFYDLQDYSIHEVYNEIVQLMHDWSGVDWLDRMYHSVRIVELLPERYLFSHVPEDKDEKKSDESPAVEVGASFAHGDQVRFHINIDVIYLLDVMAILDKAGYSMQVVRPAAVKKAVYFSEDFQSIRKVHHRGYHQLELEVKGREKYKSVISAA